MRGHVCRVCNESFSYPDGTPNPLFCTLCKKAMDDAPAYLNVLIMALVRRVERAENAGCGCNTNY